METFVVRVWRAADLEPEGSDGGSARLLGLVEHVGTGTTARFGGGEELLRFLRRSPTPIEARGEPAHRHGGESP